MEYFQVNADELMPQSVCPSCLTDLLKVYEYKHRCMENERALKSLVNELIAPAASEAENESPPITDEALDNVDEFNEDQEENTDADATFDEYVEAEEEEEEDESEENKNVIDAGFETYLEEGSAQEEEEETSAELQEENTTAEDNLTSYEDEFIKSLNRTNATQFNISNHEQQKNKCTNVVCEICGKAFPESLIIDHLNFHGKIPAYECDICQRKFSFKHNLDRHKKLHVGESPFNCNECGRAFVTKLALHAHQRSHNSTAYKFQCPECSRIFHKQSLFESHMQKIHLKTLDKEEIENYKISLTDFQNMLSETYLTQVDSCFGCKVCEKTFTSREKFEIHVRIHTGEQPFNCDICQKSFTQQASLSLHMLVHTGVRRYKCSHCNRAFKQYPHLKTHMTTHTGEKAFQCPFCKKCFAAKGNLVVHIRMHTGERPYVCAVCDRGFTHLTALKRHRCGSVMRRMEVQKVQVSYDDSLEDDMEIN